MFIKVLSNLLLALNLSIFSTPLLCVYIIKCLYRLHSFSCYYQQGQVSTLDSLARHLVFLVFKSTLWTGDTISPNICETLTFQQISLFLYFIIQILYLFSPISMQLWLLPWFSTDLPLAILAKNSTSQLFLRFLSHHLVILLLSFLELFLTQMA